MKTLHSIPTETAEKERRRRKEDEWAGIQPWFYGSSTNFDNLRFNMEELTQTINTFRFNWTNTRPLIDYTAFGDTTITYTVDF